MGSNFSSYYVTETISVFSTEYGQSARCGGKTKVVPRFYCVPFCQDGVGLRGSAVLHSERDGVDEDDAAHGRVKLRGRNGGVGAQAPPRNRCEAAQAPSFWMGRGEIVYRRGRKYINLAKNNKI